MGDKGEQAKAGDRGQHGAVGPKGEPGKAGKPGANGAQGPQVSIRFHLCIYHHKGKPRIGKYFMHASGGGAKSYLYWLL